MTIYVGGKTAPLAANFNSAKVQFEAGVASLKSRLSAIQAHTDSAATARRAELRPLEAEISSLKSKLSEMQARIDSAVTARGQPPAESAAADSALIFGLFDAVGPYRKNGLFEIYGASLREGRSEPITVTEAQVEIEYADAWVIWSADYSPARDATHIEIEFVQTDRSLEPVFGN